MSSQEEGEISSPEVTAIGISFGNSNSSIAYTSGVCLWSCPLTFASVADKDIGSHANRLIRKARQKS